jgi:hypothetical protein
LEAVEGFRKSLLISVATHGYYLAKVDLPEFAFGDEFARPPNLEGRDSNNTVVKSSFSATITYHPRPVKTNPYNHRIVVKIKAFTV